MNLTEILSKTKRYYEGLAQADGLSPSRRLGWTVDTDQSARFEQFCWIMDVNPETSAT
jgi:hypothetical protein